MTLIDEINKKRKRIVALNSAINQCTPTAAGRMLEQELKEDRRTAVYEFGLLCSNSGVKICLQSQYTS